MAHIQTLFLPGAVQTVEWNDRQVPRAVVDSKSAGLYPEHPPLFSNNDDSVRAQSLSSNVMAALQFKI